MANRLEKTVNVTAPAEAPGGGSGGSGGSSAPRVKTCQEQALEQLQAMYPGRRIFHVDNGVLPGGTIANYFVVMPNQGDTWYAPGTYYVLQEIQYTYTCVSGSVVLAQVLPSFGTAVGHGTGSSGGVG